MSGYEAILNFEHYYVEEMNYVQNDSFNLETDKLNVDYTIIGNIQISKSENKESVTLVIECGDLEKESCPFYIKVKITGIYSYNGEEKDLENFLKQNGVAILFPYARSLISDLSGKSNLFPQYNLPLINVPTMLETNGNISIEYID